MKRICTLVAAVALLCAGCSEQLGNGKWSVGTAFDYETAQIEGMYWPDPNGGLGLVVQTDSAIAGDTADNIAVGPVVMFALDPVIQGALGTALPWLELPPDVPVKLYGYFGATWEIDDENTLAGVAGTRVLFLPGRRVQPTVSAEWIRPEGSGTQEQKVRALFGATIWLQ